jgi:two-component system sensor histidine kinase AlgZ
MHPILGNGRLLGIYMLGCLPIGLVLVIGFAHHEAWGTAAVFFLPLTAIYAFICLSAFYLCRAFPLQRGIRAWRALPALLISAAIIGGLCVALAKLWAALLASLNIGLQSQLYVDQPWLLFVVGALLFWLALAFHYVLISAGASQISESRALESGLLAREAELKALRAQLDPHFLFNSLNSISSLTMSDAAAARKMSLLLADFLRATLRLGAEARISLNEELTVAQRYLAIEQVRLGDRLAVSIDASAEAGAASVPALILQPLIENAIVHGIGHLLAGGTIEVRAERNGSRLHIFVSNPCDPDRPRRAHKSFGLSLVRQRLQAQFGAEAELRIDESADRYSAEIVLRFELVQREERP